MKATSRAELRRIRTHLNKAIGDSSAIRDCPGAFSSIWDVVRVNRDNVALI
jgi:hypothetical protein